MKSIRYVKSNSLWKHWLQSSWLFQRLTKFYNRLIHMFKLSHLQVLNPTYIYMYINTYMLTHCLSVNTVFYVSKLNSTIRRVFSLVYMKQFYSDSKYYISTNVIITIINIFIITRLYGYEILSIRRNIFV